VTPYECIKSFTVPETRVFQTVDGKDLMILSCTVFDWSTRVTDRRMDRIAMAKAAFSASFRRTLEKQRPSKRNHGEPHNMSALDQQFLRARASTAIARISYGNSVLVSVCLSVLVFNERGSERKAPLLKRRYSTIIGSCYVKMAADGHRHAAYHTKHW